MPESRWFKMTEDQRHAHLHKVGTTAIVRPSDLSDSSQSVSAFTSCQSVTPSLSVQSPHSTVQLPNAKVYQLSAVVNSVADAVTIPALCLQSTWQKAEELLNSLGNIVSAPGHNEEA